MIQLLVVATRPNALDRVVNAIPAHALLTQSPYALVDPARAAAAQHFEQFTVPVWLFTVVVQIAVLAWFWNSGRSARLRDRLRASAGSEFWVRFWFGAILALIDRGAAFIPQFLQYRMTWIMGLSDVLTRYWFASWIVTTVIAMIVAGLLAALVLGLVDRTHQWYAYTVAAIIGVTLLMTYIQPFAIAPLFSTFRPLTAVGALQSDIASLRARADNTQVPIVVESVARRTHAGSAYVSGWGGSQRVVVSDTLVAGESEPELRFVIARLFGWVVANSALHLALILGAMLVLGAALAIFLADRIGFRRDDDPVSRLALVGALLGCVYLVALPFYNSYERSLDTAADAYAITLTGDRVSAIRGAVRGADQALQPICPTLLGYWYFATHPPSGVRIPGLQGRPSACR
ncbi:MAG TPA: M48 family metalloprotease [Candidatus Rubrimentiphilum sp.]|nr:M48 family metalloprotease [Candidatus Rubrimentiphilum sp.]